MEFDMNALITFFEGKSCAWMLICLGLINLYFGVSSIVIVGTGWILTLCGVIPILVGILNLRRLSNQ
jgi:hypothetical protein